VLKTNYLMNFILQNCRRFKAQVLLGAGLLLLCQNLSAQQQAALKAKFSIDATSDSTDIKSRHYTVMQYQDGQCNKPRKGARLYRKKFAKETHSFPEVEIDTDKEFFFQFDYQEQRRQGDRSCTVLLGFQPQANRSYKAIYSTSGQVSRCSVTMYDVTSAEPVEITEVSKPERTCFRGKPTNNKNSVPVHSIKPLY
jgi:hypothetical protein